MNWRVALAVGLFVVATVSGLMFGQTPTPIPGPALQQFPYAADGDNETILLKKLVQSRVAVHAVAVTPSDSTDLAHVALIWVGGAGNVRVNTPGGETDVAINGVPAGTLLPLAVTRVRSTNTTATNIVALY